MHWPSGEHSNHTHATPTLTPCLFVCRYGSTLIVDCELSAGDVVTVGIHLTILKILSKLLTVSLNQEPFTPCSALSKGSPSCKNSFLIIQVFFAVILGSFSLGNALPELVTFGTALGAASVVYDIIDRVRFRAI